MSKFIREISNLIKKLETILLFISGISLITTMTLIFLDVFLRYYYNQPLTWWHDVLTNYVMIAMFYLVIPEAFRQGQHLNIDVLQNHIPKKTLRKIHSLTYLIVGPLMLYIGYLGVNSAIYSYAQKEVLAGFISWPIWPTKTIAGLAFVILGLRGCIMTFNNK